MAEKGPKKEAVVGYTVGEYLRGREPAGTKLMRWSILGGTASAVALFSGVLPLAVVGAIILPYAWATGVIGAASSAIGRLKKA